MSAYSIYLVLKISFSLMSVSALFHSVFDLFFPRRCAQCARLLRHADPPICEVCMRSLPRTEQSHVRVNTTMELFEDMPRVERAAAFLFFDKGAAVQRLVHLFKYRHRPDIAYYLARIAAMEFSETDFFDGVDLIVPVPLHPIRERERGYNQSEFIARALSEVTGIPCDTTHLVRVRNNPQQALMRGRDREQNVHDIFSATNPFIAASASSISKSSISLSTSISAATTISATTFPNHSRTNTILLVDDLITTGSTIRSCIAALNASTRATYRVFALGKAR